MFTAKQKELVNNVHDYNKILKSRTEMFLREHPDAKEVLSSYFAATDFHPLKAIQQTAAMTGSRVRSVFRFQDQQMTRDSLQPFSFKAGRKEKRLPEWSFGSIWAIIASKKWIYL